MNFIIYGVNIPNKGAVESRCFGYTPKTSGNHNLFIKMPEPEESTEIGFHTIETDFEGNRFSMTFRVYSKREILSITAKIIGLILAPFTILGVILRLVQLGIL